MNTYVLEAWMCDDSLKCITFHRETDDQAINDAYLWFSERYACRFSAESADLSCVSGVGIDDVRERVVAGFSVKNREIITKRG